MKRSVGALALLFAAIGGIVGSGWGAVCSLFCIPFGWASAMLAWAVGGGS